MATRLKVRRGYGGAGASTRKDSVDAQVKSADREFRRSLEQMSKALRVFPDNTLRKEMNKATRSAARVIVPYVKKHVPTDTELLQKNIKASGTKTRPVVRAGTPKKGGPYAWFVHRGHGTTTGVPYLRRGISEGYGDAMAELRKGMTTAADIFNMSTRRRAARAGVYYPKVRFRNAPRN